MSPSNSSSQTSLYASAISPFLFAGMLLVFSASQRLHTCFSKPAAFSVALTITVHLPNWCPNGARTSCFFPLHFVQIYVVSPLSSQVTTISSFSAPSVNFQSCSLQSVTITWQTEVIPFAVTLISAFPTFLAVIIPFLIATAFVLDILYFTDWLAPTTSTANSAVSPTFNR